MLKVVWLPSSSPLVYQAAYLTEELEEIMGQLRARTGRLGKSVVADEYVQEMYAAMKSGESVKLEEDSKTAARKEITGDCPVCFDELGTVESHLTYCKHTCGTNFHEQCIKIWSSSYLDREPKPLAPPVVNPGTARRRKRRAQARVKATITWAVCRAKVPSVIQHIIRHPITGATSAAGFIEDMCDQQSFKIYSSSY